MHSLSPTNLHLVVKADTSHPVPGHMRGGEESRSGLMVPADSSNCELWEDR